MNEIWQWFLLIGAGIIFTIGVIDAIIRGVRYLKHGKMNANAYFDKRVLDLINNHYQEEECKKRKLREEESRILRVFIVDQLEPIKEAIKEITDLNRRLHRAQMTDLKIKLGSLYHEKFYKKGSLSRIDQANWDKWFSDYTALNGNSDILKMDELIQKARVQLTLEKATVSKTKGSSGKSLKKQQDNLKEK